MEEVWGGPAWNRHVQNGMAFMGDLRGKSVLEIGSRFGEMSRRFALMGARVTGLDTDAEALEIARLQCAGLDCRFIHYDGNLDAIEGAYDFVFTKSVLVLTDLSVMLPAIHRKLKPGGRAVFIENGRGSLLFRVARRLARLTRDFSRFHYFTPSDIASVQQAFDVRRLDYNAVPPVYLICCTKR